MGHVGLANYPGLTIGPPLSQALSGQTHPSRVWITAAILPVVAAAFATVLARTPDRALAPEASHDEPGHDGERPETARHSTLRATLRPGLGLMLVNFGYVAVLSFGAAAATEQGTGIASLVIPVFGIGVIASRTILAGIPDWFGAPRTLTGAVVIESAGLAGMAVTTSTPVALVALVVMAIGQGLAVPSLGMLALKSVPPSRHGRTAGAFFAYVDAGVGLGGTAVGLAAHAADPTGGLFAAAGAVLATAPIALLRRAAAPGSRRRSSCSAATARRSIA
jgi:predicted MFS family arabinose efflux permease